MKMATRILAVAAAMMAATACMSAAKDAARDAEGQAPAVAIAPAPEANLYVVRVNAQPWAVGVTVHVDGTKVAEIPDAHYTAIQVSPGRHLVKTTWPWWSSQRTAEVEIDVKAGAISFVNVEGISDSGYYDGVQSRTSEVTAPNAKALIEACCKFTAPRIAKLSE